MWSIRQIIEYSALQARPGHQASGAQQEQVGMVTSSARDGIGLWTYTDSFRLPIKKPNRPAHGDTGYLVRTLGLENGQLMIWKFTTAETKASLHPCVPPN